MDTQVRLPDRSIHIRKAAVRLFKTRGFMATTMRDMAEEVGIEAASLYNHIQSKQGLLHEICFGMSHRYLNNLERNLHARRTSNLRSVLESHLDIILQYTDEAAVAESEWRHLAEPARNDFRIKRQNYEDRLLGLIELAIKQKRIRQMEPKVVLYTVLAAVQWIQRWYSERRNIDKGILKQNILSMIFEGLETKGNG
ncbi:MAG: TetR/AcrR family transcriptional regulator [Saprospiraceae bacterium]|nr:TetR/AcrR family transcriptional regulator [Saprospiraceae bacterium]